MFCYPCASTQTQTHPFGKVLFLRGRSFLVLRRFPTFLNIQSCVPLVFPTLPASTFPVIPTQPLFPPFDVLAVQQWPGGWGSEGASGDTKHREDSSNHGGCSWFLSGMRANSSTYLKSSVPLRFALILVPFYSFPSHIFSVEPLPGWNTTLGTVTLHPFHSWSQRNN